MCLTMDRQEARNALSVQMVQVRGGRRPNPAASPTDNQELREGIAKTAATSSYVAIPFLPYPYRYKDICVRNSGRTQD